MKISQLESILANLRADYGDVEVGIDTNDWFSGLCEPSLCILEGQVSAVAFQISEDAISIEGFVP